MKKGGLITVTKQSSPLARYRKQRGLTQAELANACGMSFTGLRRLETGAEQPTDSQLEILAQVLGVEPCDIKPDPPLQAVLSNMVLRNAVRLADPSDEFAKGWHAAILAIMDVYGIPHE